MFVQRFPPTGERWLLSPDGGMFPQWRPDGRELFYLRGARLMAVDVRTDGARLAVGTPHLLFQAPFPPCGRTSFLSSRDGQKFLAILQAERPETPTITVELNWMARLKR